MTCYTPRWWWRRQWSWVSPVHLSGHLTSVCRVLFFMLTIIDHLTNTMPAMFYLPRVDTSTLSRQPSPSSCSAKQLPLAIEPSVQLLHQWSMAVWTWDGENTSSEISWQVATMLAKQVTYFKSQNRVSIPVILPPTVSVYPKQKGTKGHWQKMSHVTMSLCSHLWQILKLEKTRWDFGGTFFSPMDFVRNCSPNLESRIIYSNF